jgi:hypothetical protein
MRFVAMGVLAGLTLGCAHGGAQESKPVPPTWERFEREMRCAEAAGHSDFSAFSATCQKRSFEVLLETYENAVCTSDSDCEAVYGWLPVGPWCVAAQREWVRRAHLRLSSELVDACGFVDAYSDERCETVCLGGRCQIKGRNSLGLPPGIQCPSGHEAGLLR